jgi:hypothetical protein
VLRYVSVQWSVREKGAQMGDRVAAGDEARVRWAADIMVAQGPQSTGAVAPCAFVRARLVSCGETVT